MPPANPQPTPTQPLGPAFGPPQQPAPYPAPFVPPPSPQPQPGNRKKWLILIAIALVLVAAGGLLFWRMRANNPSPTTTANEAHQTPDTVDVRNVVWVEPFNLPGSYKKYDETFEGAKTFVYEDTAIGCWITTDIAPYGVYSHYGKTPRDVALDIEDQEGVTIAKNQAGPAYAYKDVDGKHTYQFESMQLDKDLNVPSLDYKKEHTVVAYKPFGVWGVSIGFSCKDATWGTKKAEVEQLAKQFTLRTER